MLLSTLTELAWYHYGSLILAGFAAGVVNTLAGNGSVFTLSTLIFFGLPASVANATNRIGTVLQGATAVGVMSRHDKQIFNYSLPYLLPSLIGALLGAWLVVDLSDQALRLIMGSIMLLLLVVILLNPKKGLKEGEGKPAHPVIRTLSLFGIGFYGGVIQAGIGILLIVSLVSLASHSMVKANAIKLVVVLVYSLPVLGIFIWHGQVEWVMGSWVALGQVAGSFLAARFAVKSQAANRWIRYLLITMILLAVAKLFQLI